MTPPLFRLNFGVFPLHQCTDVGVNVSRYLKLFGCEIIFEVSQPIWSRYPNITEWWTDRHTDRQTYCGITALCAKKPIISTARTDANSTISPGLKEIISPASYIYGTVSMHSGYQGYRTVVWW